MVVKRKPYREAMSDVLGGQFSDPDDFEMYTVYVEDDEYEEEDEALFNLDPKLDPDSGTYNLFLDNNYEIDDYIDEIYKSFGDEDFSLPGDDEENYFFESESEESEIESELDKYDEIDEDILKSVDYEIYSSAEMIIESRECIACVEDIPPTEYEILRERIIEGSYTVVKDAIMKAKLISFAYALFNEDGALLRSWMADDDVDFILYAVEKPFPRRNIFGKKSFKQDCLLYVDLQLGFEKLCKNQQIIDYINLYAPPLTRPMRVFIQLMDILKDIMEFRLVQEDEDIEEADDTILEHFLGVWEANDEYRTETWEEQEEEYEILEQEVIDQRVIADAFCDKVNRDNEEAYESIFKRPELEKPKVAEDEEEEDEEEEEEDEEPIEITETDTSLVREFFKRRNLIKELHTEYYYLKRSDLREEHPMRLPKRVLEARLGIILRRYDTNIMKMQLQFEDAYELYLEKFNERMEEECLVFEANMVITRCHEEDALREKRILFRKLRAMMRNRAARIIQTAWRAYWRRKTRRSVKKQKKRRKVVKRTR